MLKYIAYKQNTHSDFLFISDEHEIEQGYKVV